MSMKKTNALRILDQLGFSYDLLTYDYDPALSQLEKVAAANELDPEQIFKTLVCKGDKTGIVVAVIPSSKKLVLKVLAKQSGNKKMALVPMQSLQGLTGYIRGGCSPLGMKKEFPVFIAAEAQALDKVFVNAGKRGFLFGIEPENLSIAAEATFAAITE